MIASKSISILTQKLLQVMDNIHNQEGRDYYRISECWNGHEP